MLDHLILAAADLETGIDFVERMTGVRAVFGGRHPHWGTHNALLSLGNGQYLEILSPDPAGERLAPHLAFLKDLPQPRLWTWAASTDDIVALADRADRFGYAHSGVRGGSRVRADGSRLSWRTLTPALDGNGLVPFFIQWDAGSAHPSADAPGGCRLLAFEMFHPEPEPIRTVLRNLGLEVEVKTGPEPRPRATLTTPDGSVASI